MHRFYCVSIVAACFLLNARSSPAQGPPSMSSGVPSSPSNPLNSFISSNIEVTVKGADGKPVPGQITVQLVNAAGQIFDQTSVKNGIARFSEVPKTELRVLVIAPGYKRAEKSADLTTGSKMVKVTVALEPMSAEDAASDRAIGALNPKAQKEVGKALDALHKNKTADAYTHLQAAQKHAPNDAEVEYLLGVYATQVNDVSQARAHWKKALELNPNHLSALLEAAQAALDQHNAGDALSYVNRALVVEPSSWRAHAIFAEAIYLQGNRDEAIKQAERALDLGHQNAAAVEPFLAGLVAESGDTGRAKQILEEFLKDNPSNAAAAKQLEQLNHPEVASSAAPLSSPVASTLATMNAATLELPVRSNWLPPDVDERVPAVDATPSCNLDEVLHKAGDQVVALVHNVERFSATEWVVDESISKWGVASPWDKRKFDYIVSIQQIRPGILSVDEFRSAGGGPADFPDGFITNGLPALVMIFHPFYVGNYEMTCEGLAHRSSGPAWQVHFRQRPDKSMSIKAFRLGMHGTSYPAALKGRAWISAENYQILRLETDLVQRAPEIHLNAEHTAIEYGSIDFRENNVKLWLPLSAEVYFDWSGHRVHRKHTFNNYMLFSVDEQQRISSPKTPKPSADDVKGDAPTSLE